MINKGKDPLPNQDINIEEIFSDKMTEKKIRQHLSDWNDVISDQDIKNVRTDYDRGSTQDPAENKSSAAFQENKSNTADNNTENKKDIEAERESQPVITPWDILDK